MAERKKKPQDTETVRPENASVGETLRAARIARNMELEDVSVTIHIRPSQLKAIEENDIESLPGMTYAIGFVRSYANFLGLNGAEIVHRFKAEQGHSPAPSKLSFPEPIVESRVPDPLMVGIGAFLAVVILVGWTIYANVHGSNKEAEEIPAAPVVATVEAAPEAPAAALAPPAASAAPAPAASELTPAPAAAATEAPKTETPEAAKADSVTEAPKTEAAEAFKPAEETKAEVKAAESKPKEKKPEEESIIAIKKGKSRITLKATQASWVQVMDADGEIIYKKVLRPGEQLSIPDQPGLRLDTANAGGLSVIVDGKPTQTLGRSGEIVRGVSLDPRGLKVERMRVNN